MHHMTVMVQVLRHAAQPLEGRKWTRSRVGAKGEAYIGANGEAYIILKKDIVRLINFECGVQS